MTSIRRLRLLLCAALIAPLVIATAQAQTIANGPYYAVPAWDQTLPAATRFVVLSNFDGKAVLDRETGLVWQRFVGGFRGSWLSVAARCRGLSIGNRMGWRLPTIEELTSLAAEGGVLPSGHPFQGISDAPDVTSYYWSSSSLVFNEATGLATYVFAPAVSTLGISWFFSTAFDPILPGICVRGGIGTGMTLGR